MTEASATSKAERAPGMIDVARLAGVSAQTVSRTLSGHPNVQESTRRRVLAAVDQLGYRRNNAARALSSGHSRTIGVVSLRTGFYSRAAVTAGIEAAATAAGYSVNIATTASLEAAAVGDAMSRLADQDVEGIVLAVPLLRDDRAIEELTARIPTVTIDGSRTPSAELVAIDQASVGRVATEHLLTLGHDTVWHLAGPQEWLDSAGRTAGWRAALEEAGRTVPPELHGDWSPESGYRNGLVIGRIPSVTAIFVASDEMAFGLIRALHELGRRVPADVSVASVDNIPLAEFCTPPLTTISQPFGEMAHRAVAHLLRHLTNPASAPAPESVEPQLIIRASTSAPPSALCS